MKFLLDSDIVIDLLENDIEASDLVRRLIVEGIGPSVISYMEITQGLHRKPLEQRLKFERFVAGIAVLPVDIAIADRCAQLRTWLQDRNRRARSRSLDLLVAATAIHLDLTLVTRNLNDYKDLPGLTIYR